MRILIAGGCKCGKSNTAQAWACKMNRKRYYWATMIPSDDEDMVRVRRHVDYRRDMDFITVECGRDLTAALPEIDTDSAVVFDSLTAWLANEMFDEKGCHELSDRMINDILTVSSKSENFICTVDEMWRDIAYDGWTEKYREALGKICCILADKFDVVCEVSADRVHFHKVCSDWKSNQGILSEEVHV